MSKVSFRPLDDAPVPKMPAKPSRFLNEDPADLTIKEKALRNGLTSNKTNVKPSDVAFVDPKKSWHK